MNEGSGTNSDLTFSGSERYNLPACLLKAIIQQSSGSGNNDMAVLEERDAVSAMTTNCCITAKSLHLEAGSVVRTVFAGGKNSEEKRSGRLVRLEWNEKKPQLETIVLIFL